MKTFDSVRTVENDHDYGRSELPDKARAEDVTTIRGRLRAAMIRAQLEPDYAELWRLLNENGLELNKQTPHNWFRKIAKSIDSRYLFKVADALNVSARWLATGEPPVVPMPREVVPGAARLLDAYVRLPKDYRAAVLAGALGMAEEFKRGDVTGDDGPEPLWTGADRRRGVR